MDTDSLIFEIIGENFNDIMLEHKENFDLSNFPKDSEYYDPTNKKVPGKMKDEYPGTDIAEVVAIKRKSYSIKNVNNKEKITHKVTVIILNIANIKMQQLIKKFFHIQWEK